MPCVRRAGCWLIAFEHHVCSAVKRDRETTVCSVHACSNALTLNSVLMWTANFVITLVMDSLVSCLLSLSSALENHNFRFKRESL